MLVLEDSNVISLIPSGGNNNRDMYRLNNVGNNTPPCGTSCLTLLYLELMILNVTYVCLPVSFQVIFLLLVMMVITIIWGGKIYSGLDFCLALESEESDLFSIDWEC